MDTEEMDLSRYEMRPFTYDQVGATTGDMPRGYHHVNESRVIGRGRPAFETAGTRIVDWDMHRGSGLRVSATTVRAEVGSVVVLGLGPVRIPCRVTEVFDGPAKLGFAYGTLQGHPESGEEAFWVELDSSGVVTAHVRAFSKAGNPIVALGGPLNRVMQRAMTHRYLAALT